MKEKLEYSGHVYFEPVRPRLILRILQFFKKSNTLYHDIDINLSNIPDCLVLQNKKNKIFFTGVNILDYVATCEFIPITIETIGCDSKKHNHSNEPVIQDALNSLSNDCAVPIFVEKERISIENIGNAKREAKSVDPLIPDEKNLLTSKSVSWKKIIMKKETSTQILIFQEVKT